MSRLCTLQEQELLTGARKNPQDEWAGGTKVIHKEVFIILTLNQNMQNCGDFDFI